MLAQLFFNWKNIFPTYCISQMEKIRNLEGLARQKLVFHLLSGHKHGRENISKMDHKNFIFLYLPFRPSILRSSERQNCHT